MNTQPILETERLLLGPLSLADAPAIQQLAGRREIADTTISIPHPCSEQNARDWISGITEAFALGTAVAFASVLKESERLVGTVGLRDINREHLTAEMGFWVSVGAWGHGYATESAVAVLRYGFEQLGLNRIYAHHMTRNTASGRVLEKIGMRREGIFRQRVRKWGVFEDVACLAILREDYESAG